MAAPPPPSAARQDLRSCGTVMGLFIVSGILVANVVVTVRPSAGGELCLQCGPLPPVQPPLLTLGADPSSDPSHHPPGHQRALGCARNLYWTRGADGVDCYHCVSSPGMPLITVDIVGLAALFLYLP